MVVGLTQIPSLFGREGEHTLCLIFTNLPNKRSLKSLTKLGLFPLLTTRVSDKLPRLHDTLSIRVLSEESVLSRALIMALAVSATNSRSSLIHGYITRTPRHLQGEREGEMGRGRVSWGRYNNIPTS